MSKSTLFKKGFVVTVIVLFVSLVTIPAISGNATTNIQNEFLDFMECSNDYFDVLTDRVGDRGWGWWWPEFPGKIEPFFNLQYEIDELVTEEMAEMHGMDAADFNDDGLMDFAVSWKELFWETYTYLAHISIFYNQGIGNGFSKIDVFEFNYTNIADLNAEDFDGDGDVDLLYTYSEVKWHNGLPYRINGTGNILFNNGDNTFTEEHRVFWHGPGDPENREHNRINPQVSSADFNGDGDIDFIVGDNTGLVAFYKNDGTGNFTWVCDSDFGYIRGVSWGVAGADFDNDGDVDFIVTEMNDPIEGFVYLKYNDGSDSCFNHSNYRIIMDIPDYDNMSFFTFCAPAFGYMRAIDYNDDGMMDFIFAGFGYIFLNIQVEAGVFQHFSACRFPATNPNHDGSFKSDYFCNGGICIGDFNNDGLDDAMLGGTNYIIKTLYNTCNLVDIVFPDRTCFIVNNEIESWILPLYPLLNHGTSIIKGDVTVVAKELEPLSKVEFYLDNKLVFTDDASPFEWNWNRFSFGRHKVKVVAYDLDGNEAGFDDTIVWKFL